MYPIPANATRIRYLESTGTQYVDTGWSLTTDDVCDVDFQFTNVSTYQQRVVEQRNGTYGFEMSLYIANDANLSYLWQLQENSTIFTNTNVAASASRMHYIIDGPARKILAGSSVVVDNRSAITTADGTMLIGSANASRRPYARIYSLTITRGSTLVRSFVPVRVGQVGYLFDRVSGQLFGNAGTGDFVLGPDTFQQGVVPTRMMAMGVRNTEVLGSVVFSGSNFSNLYGEESVELPTSYSFSFWCKATSAPSTGCFVKIGRGQTTTSSQDGTGVGVGIGSTNFGNSGSKLVLLKETVAWAYSSSNISEPTKWHHYVVVVDNKNQSVYIDGVSKLTSTGNSYRSSPTKVYIGGYDGAPNSQTADKRFSACSITRVAMWTRALSSSEIAADYADGKKAPTTTSGLSHYWPLQNSKNYLKDEVGSARLAVGTAGVTLSNDTPFA